jgi:sortase A
MVVAGLALLASVAWREWGTGAQTTRAQQVLQAELDQRFPTRPIPGGAIGLISIPRIHVRLAFVQGVTADALAEGPGHYPATAMPGGRGNVAIAGHRTTHGAPFWSLDRVRTGDAITLQTHAGTFVYRVVWQRVVAQDAWWITRATGRPSLTLSTCTPRFTSRQRLVVRAVEVSELPSRVRRWRVPKVTQPLFA